MIFHIGVLLGSENWLNLLCSRGLGLAELLELRLLDEATTHAVPCLCVVGALLVVADAFAGHELFLAPVEVNFLASLLRAKVKFEVDIKDGLVEMYLLLFVRYPSLPLLVGRTGARVHVDLILLRVVRYGLRLGENLRLRAVGHGGAGSLLGYSWLTLRNFRCLVFH